MPTSSSLSDSSEGSSTQPSSAILEWMRHAQIRALVVDDATAAALSDEAPPNASLRNYLASEALFDHSQQQLLVPTGTAYLDWLARLCEACRTFDNAGHSSPNFEAAWVSVAQLHVEGTPITQQIDVAVAHKRGITPATTSAASGRGLSNVNAAAVLVVLEAKYSSTSKSKGDVDERAARYARLLNEHSPSRPHRVCIAVCMSSVALYVFGPSGFFKAEFKRSVASPTPEAMLALQRWARVKFVDALVAEERVDGGSLSLDQGKKVCWKGKPRLVFVKKTLGGSLTNVWRIKVPDGSVKVLKLAWANAAMAQREGEIYERLRQSVQSFLGAVPTMCSGLSGIVSQGQANDEIGGKRLVAIVLDGEPLQPFDQRGKEGLIALIRGVRDAARIIFWLEKVKVHHRDISSGNLQRQLAPADGFDHAFLDEDWLLPPSDTSARRDTGAPVLTSCLIDFGGAKSMDDTSESPTFRSGTWVFMSRAAYASQDKNILPVKGEPVKAHRGWHDLESLVNVLYWLMLNLFVVNDKYLKRRRCQWEEKVPGTKAQLWADMAETVGQMRSLAPNLQHLDGVNPLLIPKLLRGTRTLFDKSLADRHDDYEPEDPAGEDANEFDEYHLRTMHELYGVTDDIDKTLLTGFVKLCNSTVKALLNSDAPVVPVP